MKRRRDVVAGRAGLLAGRRRAVDAALGFDDRRLEVIAEKRLVPVVHALGRLLLVDGLDGYLEPSEVIVRLVRLFLHGAASFSVPENAAGSACDFVSIVYQKPTVIQGRPRLRYHCYANRGSPEFTSIERRKT